MIIKNKYGQHVTLRIDVCTTPCRYTNISRQLIQINIFVLKHKIKICILLLNYEPSVNSVGKVIIFIIFFWKQISENRIKKRALSISKECFKHFNLDIILKKKYNLKYLIPTIHSKNYHLSNSLFLLIMSIWSLMSW